MAADASSTNVSANTAAPANQISKRTAAAQGQKPQVYSRRASMVKKEDKAAAANTSRDISKIV